jgi:hypothetical protein
VPADSDDYLFKSRKTSGQLTTWALGHVIEKYIDLAGLRPDKDGHMWNARNLRETAEGDVLWLKKGWNFQKYTPEFKMAAVRLYQLPDRVDLHRNPINRYFILCKRQT